MSFVLPDNTLEELKAPPVVHKPRPSYAPVYAALYPEISAVAREYGYVLAVHGSLQRDFDVVAIAWAEDVRTPLELIEGLVLRFDFKLIGGPTLKNHGRVAWTLACGFGECSLDLSFTPTIERKSHASGDLQNV